jgi:hypothetical protein
MRRASKRVAPHGGWSVGSDVEDKGWRRELSNVFGTKLECHTGTL